MASLVRCLSVLSVILIMCFSSDHFVFCKDNKLDVLLEVKKSFVEDPEGVLHDWSESNPNFCTWRGVSCGLDSVDGSVEVLSLNLSDSSLAGSISPSLGLLQNLLHLDLSNNRLSGPIPPDLSNLSSLESLLLFSNQLTGPIPTQLGSLTSVRVMRLGDNGLTGPIPSSFGNLVNLVTLAWPHAVSPVQYPGTRTTRPSRQFDSSTKSTRGSDSTRAGKLLEPHSLYYCSQQAQRINPGDLGRLKNLQILNLANNSLSGEIPSELGELSQLGYMNFMGNQLEGPIPKSLAQLGNLQNSICR
ncbi:hypothetical protein SLA2020_416910 [Shorea laevis]